MERAAEKKVFASRTSLSVEMRILELCLQIPDLGAKRLSALLEGEAIGISASTVYNVLKRHGLNTREKRYAKMESQTAVETPPRQKCELPSSHASAVPNTGDQALSLEKTGAKEPLPAEEAPLPLNLRKDRSLRPGKLRLSESPKKNKRRSPWLLAAINYILIILIIYLGFNLVQKIRSSTSVQPGVEAAVVPPPAFSPEAPKIKPLLSRYSTIWKRNLFNVAKKEGAVPPRVVDVEKIAPAGKDLGLKLVGTVVADNAELSRAFIENHRKQRQEILHIGDKAGDVRIKKILRNKVIIATNTGEKLLSVEIGPSTIILQNSTYAQYGPGSQDYPQNGYGPKKPGKSFSLERGVVAAALGNIEEVANQFEIAPYIKDGQPAGFTIGRIPPQSILRNMGLQNGVAILGVDDESITSPDEADEFFQRLAQGGDLSIKVRTGRGIGRRTRYLNLSIN